METDLIHFLKCLGKKESPLCLKKERKKEEKCKFFLQKAPETEEQPKKGWKKSKFSFRSAWESEKAKSGPKMRWKEGKRQNLLQKPLEIAWKSKFVSKSAGKSPKSL